MYLLRVEKSWRVLHGSDLVLFYVMFEGLARVKVLWIKQKKEKLAASKR